MSVAACSLLRSGRVICALAVAAVLVPASAAQAQDDRRPRDMSFELGAALGIFLPSDEHEFYDATQGPQEPISDIAPDILVRLGFYPRAFIGLEAEGGAAFAETDSGGSVTLPHLRGSLVLQLPARVTPFLMAGLGNIWTRSGDDVLGDDRDRVWHVGAGAKFYLTRNLHARLDGRWYYTNRLRDGLDDNGMVSHWEITLGAGFTFGGTSDEAPAGDDDPDGDGYAGDADACPTEAGVAPDGCPERDSDGDGIADADDQCPDQPETANGHEDEDGCPDEQPDADGDGITGDADGCPDQPEDMDGFEDEDGCPEEDNDKDGVVDDSDACPTEAGVVENRGCPDTDKDGDGVVDRLDNCPDEKGTAENQGCKKKQQVVITQTQLKITDNVFFATGKPNFLRRSRPLLDNVAQVLKAHPEIKKVRVEGHTDDRGADEFNQSLSQKRAEYVVQYLIGKGIEPERLEPVGYGESKPVGDNSTAAGRAANRRVEFNIIDPAPPAQP
ncbi:MAG TPA: OmpA family protein [Kofleriaceae bacterium]|nr:OmpA family protein [Kofleriaceae bacterium]